VTKNHQSAGIVPGGAIIEKDAGIEIESWETVSLLLRNPDFTTAIRTTEAIDGVFGKGSATAVSAGLVRAAIPATFRGRVVEYISTIEGLNVNVDIPAKVVVNERTGTVVLGEQYTKRLAAVRSGNRIQRRTDYGHRGCSHGGEGAGVQTDCHG
jgi:flagellar P-ring protein precursor FlgI